MTARSSTVPSGAPPAPAASGKEAATARRRADVVESRFEVVKKRRAFEDICEQIGAEIAAGRLRPGDRLPAERELAEQFGVSRSAVREALRSLEMAGIVESRLGINGGAVVRRGDPEVITRAVRDMVFLGQISIESLTEARILITNDAIRLACERATEADLDAIERDVDRWDERVKRGDLPRRTREIVEFYRLIGRATHNEVLVMMVDSLSEIARLLLARVAPEPRSAVAAVRRRIVKHLRARDAEQAVAAMTTHLKKLSRYLEAQERATKPAP